MYRPLKRIMRQKRSQERRIAAEMEAKEHALKNVLRMSPEEITRRYLKAQARRHGRPSHHGKPETYYQRRNVPKFLRAAA